MLSRSLAFGAAFFWWAGLANSADQRIGSWLYDEIKDPITDQRGAGMIAYGKSNRRSEIVLKCERERVTLSFSNPSKKYLETSPRWFVLRINDDKSTLAVGNANAGTGILANRISRQNYERLSKARSIAIRVFEPDGSSYDLQYQVSQTEKAFARFSKICPASVAPERDVRFYDPGVPLPEIPKT